MSSGVRKFAKFAMAYFVIHGKFSFDSSQFKFQFQIQFKTKCIQDARKLFVINSEL